MLEEPAKIDIIVPQDDAIVLIIVDAGTTADEAQRLAMLQAKLATYASYIGSPEFKAEYPTSKGKQVLIKIVSPHPPTGPMASIESVGCPVAGGPAVPVVFERFPAR